MEEPRLQQGIYEALFLEFLSLSFFFSLISNKLIFTLFEDFIWLPPRRYVSDFFFFLIYKKQI